MSLYRLYFIRCNGEGCRRFAPSDGDISSHAARRSARRVGWKRWPGSARSGRDYCPSCAMKSENQPDPIFAGGLR